MNVDKVILRACLSTLAAIGVLLVFIAVALCAAFPSTMMTISYDMGMETSSIHFAERAYKRSDDVYYIAYATEVAILEGKEKKILSCGDKFLKDAYFEEYCEGQEDAQGYKLLIYSQVCLAQYAEGEKTEAVERACAAFAQNEFPTERNPLVAVLFAAKGAGDTDTVALINSKLTGLQPTGTEKAYLDEIIAWVNG